MANKIRLKSGARTANILNLLEANSDEWLTSPQITKLVKVKDASGQLTHMTKKGVLVRKKNERGNFVYQHAKKLPKRQTTSVATVEPPRGNGSASRNDVLMHGVDAELFRAATRHAEYKHALARIRDILNNLEGLD